MLLEDRIREERVYIATDDTEYPSKSAAIRRQCELAMMNLFEKAKNMHADDMIPIAFLKESILFEELKDIVENWAEYREVS